MSLQKRPTGSEQPSALGVLKLRVPFVHYKIEIPDVLQGGNFMCCSIKYFAAYDEGVPDESVLTDRN